MITFFFDRIMFYFNLYLYKIYWIHLVISIDFDNCEEWYIYFQTGHCIGTVLSDPLSYATISFRSLEGSHMTVSTVVPK